LLSRLYFDSLVFDPQALRHLIDLVGADHVCIGTDAPFDMADMHPADTIAAVPRLTTEEREQICSGTALRLLGEVPPAR
jgi:aminocarboxymuconate-semialdehyde decarboxylase